MLTITRRVRLRVRLIVHAHVTHRAASTTRRTTGLWCCTSKIFAPSMAFTQVSRARHPHVPALAGWVTTRIQDPLVRTDHLLAAHGDFVMALRQSGFPSRRPPATGPLGCYPDRTSTGKSIAACQDTPHQPTRQRERAMKRFHSAGGAQRFLSAFSGISPHFRPRRHRFTAAQYRHEMTTRFTTWNQVTGLAPAAA
jgi:hypothetical protein